MHPIKKHYYLLSIVLALFNTVYGQATTIIEDPVKISNNKLEKIKFGIELGGDYSAGSYAQDVKSAFIEYKFFKVLGIKTSPSYIEKALVAARNSSLSKYKRLAMGFKIQTLEIPIILRLYPSSILKGFCISIGIQPGYIIGGTVDITQGGEFIPEHGVWNYRDKTVPVTLTEANKKVKVQRFQFGIIGGFDYEFGFGLYLGYRTYRGLTDILKTEKFPKFARDNFIVGYNFAKLVKITLLKSF